MSSTNIEKNLASAPASCTGQPSLSSCSSTKPAFNQCPYLAGSCQQTGSNKIIYDTSTTTTTTSTQCSNRGVTGGASNSCLPAPFALWIRDTTYLYLAIQTWGADVIWLSSFI